MPTETNILPSAELSFHSLGAQTDVEALTILATRARDAGWVKDGFIAALLTREAAHPTGLPTHIPVAIPHADPEHVIRPGIALALFTDPVEFGEMGQTGARLPVRAAAMLLVTDPAAQVDLLRRLVGVFQRTDWLEKCAATSNEAELVGTFSRLLDEQGK